MFLREPLAFFGADLSAGVKVTFVTNEHDRHVWVAVLSHFFEPAGQMGEGVASGNIVDQQGTCCASVVRPRYALEGLLPCRVPDLQFDVLIVNLDSPSSKLNADRQIVLLPESFVCKLQQKTGLADS